MPRTYLEQARYDAAQEATSELKWEREPAEEDVEEAYGAVQDVTLRESFDQPLSTAERRQRAYLPAAQWKRDQAKLYTPMTESSRKRPSSPLEPESYSKQSSDGSALSQKLLLKKTYLNSKVLKEELHRLLLIPCDLQASHSTMFYSLWTSYRGGMLLRLYFIRLFLLGLLLSFRDKLKAYYS